MRSLVTVFLAVLALQPARAQQVAQVDQIFAEFHGTSGPGCVVGIARDGHEIMSRAYGMADLEHGVINTPDTVFEPGSVSKQFTAAATILLALDGALSLDDDVRTWIPELPDYGETITIRQLLNHTSGLRDWGSVAGIGGWPRTTRVHTHVHMLDIASRQLALNYPPGTYYSYTNTGYNLQAVIVERASGMPFAEFSRLRIFEPLGLTRTQWRDDFTRVVPDRAIAYSRRADGTYAMNMPFENVHGNGGLLTTVGDLLRFTESLETGELGGESFITEMHTQGVLNSGRTISYASGLVVGQYNGFRQVAHSGETAGYRGYLARFPDHDLGVAVMCNAAFAGAGALAHRVADLFLPEPEEETREPVTPWPMDAADLQALAGPYRQVRNESFVPVTVIDMGLQAGGTRVVPTGPNEFRSGSGRVLRFLENGIGEMTFPDGDVVRIEPVDPFDKETALDEFTGRWRSEEAEVTVTLRVRDGRLESVDRYGRVGTLTPLYRDAFRSSGGTVIFRRDAQGRAQEISLVQSRVWDLRFRRVE